MSCTKSITLETLTPLCSNGADKYSLEFRITELKSLMRFWWRAINTFGSVSEMKKKEGELFGSTELKSPLRIRLDSYKSHKMNNSEQKKWLNRISGISPQSQISLIFSYSNHRVDQDQMDYYINLLKISLILGGLGKRSRRGGGVLKLVEIDGEVCTNENVFLDLQEAFENLEVNGEYNFEKNEITRKKDLPLELESYPFLKEIVIDSKGSTLKNFKQRIQRAMKQTKNISYCMQCERMACPIYLSAYGDSSDALFPIVSVLHNTNPSKTYDQYKNKILKEVIECTE